MAKSLINCEDLYKEINAGLPKDTVIVDVSWSSKKKCYEDYLKCHIPGAVFVNVLESEHTDLYPRNIPKSDIFERNVRQAGINDNSRVILYSESDNFGFFASCRAWWTFMVYGHSNVSVLNGGLPKWKSLGYPVSSDVVKVLPGSFTAKWTPTHHKKFDEVVKNVEQGVFQVCDTRSSGAYLGQDSPGHIPGAVNLNYGQLMDTGNQTLLSPDKIKTVFADAGVDLSRPLVTHCNSGMSSCSVAFAAKLCGSEDVSVFHGGFTEWKAKADPELLTKETPK
ncbi:hypothetical protein SNE40_003707 [Patella caerulea]|uniref:Rhodanese domain-containing protein n=1 Tax=Patella caerulea TaxID=87958 RepID=A0AAN8KER7_PATCE